MNQILGALLIAIPFVGVFAYAAHELGWKDTGLAFGLLAVVIILIGAGSVLITGG